MEHIREVVDSEILYGIFNVPDSLRGRKVEVIVLPFQEEKERGGSAFGCLRKYANPSLIPEEKGAWERAAVKKYEDS